MKKERIIPFVVGGFLVCFLSSLVSAILCANIIRDKIKPANEAYVDISEQWYEQITYLGYNSFFNEHQYCVIWEEGEKGFWKTIESEMGPSEFVIYAQGHEKKFLGKGFAK